MFRFLATARFVVLACFLLALTACGGGGGTAGGINIDGLAIDIRPLASEQNSAIVTVTLTIPRTNSSTPVPVRIRIGWRLTANPNDPIHLMNAADGAVDLNNIETILNIPPGGTEIQFLWDALGDLGIDWSTETQLTIRAGILRADAPDAREAVCDFEPIITIGFGNTLACTSDAPQLDGQTLEQATVGVPYSSQLDFSGGEPPLRFEALDAEGNPQLSPDLGFGLILNQETGAITGTPTADAPEIFRFVIRLVDSCGEVNNGQRAASQALPGGRFDQAFIEIPIQGGVPPICEGPDPQITTTTIPDGELDVPYSFQLEATGGEGALTWTAIELPAGFSLDTNGLLTGTPTAAGSFGLIVEVSDSCEQARSIESSFDIDVACGDPPSFEGIITALPDAFVGSPYDEDFDVSTPNGPGTVVLDSGAMPEGLTLSAIPDAGNRVLHVSISGTPTNAGQAGQTFNFTLRASDTCPEAIRTTTATFALQLNAASLCLDPAPQIASPTGTSDLPDGSEGAPYSVVLQVTNGTAPVGPVTVLSGAPAGLSIQPDGRTFAGTLGATSAGDYDITFEVADACDEPSPRTDRAVLTLTVSDACDAISITTTGLPDVTLGSSYDELLSTNGGFGAVTWELDSGVLPADLILSTDGRISGTANAKPGTYGFVVRATDACPGGLQSDTQSLSITVLDTACNLPSITTTGLADPVFGEPYTGLIEAAGDEPPFSFALSNGRLPSGLTLAADGSISGTADDKAEIGVPFTFDVTVTDSCATPGSDVASFTLTVQPGGGGCDPLTIANTGFPNAVLGQSYNATLLNNGGLAPFSWALSAGTLPSGLTVDPSGAITGIPNDSKEVGTTFDFSVEVTDSCAPIVQTDSADFSITLDSVPTCATAQILTTSLPDPILNQDYDIALSGTGEGALTWALASGTLPSGLTVTPAGVIAGSPDDDEEVGDSFTFEVALTDSCPEGPQTDLASFTVTLQEEFVCTTIEITTTSLPDATIGQPYGASILGSGEGTLSWSLIGGALPTGINLGVDGSFTGSASEPTEIDDTFDFTAQVTDECINGAQSTTADLSITVRDAASCVAVDITNTSFPDPVLGQAYNATLLANGEAPFTWALASGPLPTGMGIDPSGALTGIPTDPLQVDQTFDFQLEVTDSCSTGAQTDTADFSFTLTAVPTCATLDILTTSVPDPVFGEDYVQSLSVVGVDPITWNLFKSTLPEGMDLSTDGVISGNPSNPDDIGEFFSFTVEARDSCSLGTQLDAQLLSFTVQGEAPCGQLTLDNSGFSDPVLNQAYSATLFASGGFEPYEWSLFAGNLPTGMFVDSAGTLEGTPTELSEVGTTFDFTLQVTDNCPQGQQSTVAEFSFTLTEEPTCAGLDILTTSLPNPFYQQSYGQNLSIVGEAPFTWDLTGVLPEGLTFDAGSISGIPTNSDEIGQTFDFTVDVTDSCSLGAQSDSQAFSFTLDGPAACDDLSITNTGFPNALLNQAYSATLMADGGFGTLHWSLAGGSLPDGLSVEESGSLSGTPTNPGQVGTTFDFTLEVEDECGLGTQIESADFQITLDQIAECATIDILTTSLPNPEWLVEYNQALSAVGEGALTWALIGNALPEGLTLGTDGVIGGVPSDPAQIGQTFDFTVQVSDTCSLGAQIDSQDFSFTLTGPSCGPVSILTDSLPDATVGDPYDVTLDASGDGPFSWELTGSLPAGLTFDQSGQIFGTPNDPTEAGSTFNVSLTVSDSCVVGTQTDSIDLTIFLNGAPACDPIVITTEFVPDPTVGEEFDFALEAEGGVPPHEWAQTGGTLPSGLSVRPEDGHIVGTPNQPSQAGLSFTFEVTVTDMCPFNPGSDSEEYTFTLLEATSCEPLEILNSGFFDPQLGQPYSMELMASGEGPVTWAMTGDLPTGMSVDPSGTLEGTPTEATEVDQTFEFTLIATDSCPFGQQTADETFIITLLGAPSCEPVVEISTLTLPNPTLGEPYGVTIETTGGVAPLGWMLTVGELPEGLSFNIDGTITGTPTNSTQVGDTFEFEIGVMDDCPFNPSSDTQAYAITLGGTVCGTLEITNASFQNPYVGESYTTELTADGDTPFTWNLVGGSLPTGMSVAFTLDRGWVLTGTPTVNAEIGRTFNFTLEVTDLCANGPQSDTESFSFVLGGPACGTPKITSPTHLPDAFYEDAYDYQMTATNGRAPHTYRILWGCLPHGVSMSSSGRITGTPDRWWQRYWTFCFVVQAYDDCGRCSCISFHKIRLRP